MDIAILGDSRIHEKELEKIEKYQDLKWEIRRMWDIKNMDVVPVVVGPLEVLPRNLENGLKNWGLWKTMLLGTARILRKVLDF